MVDWSATAAWITLVVTLIISIVSPVITTWMNHRFQLRLAELEAKNKEIEHHYLKKRAVIDDFIASVGKCLFRADSTALQECGQSFYAIYVYVPPSLWPDIDTLLQLITARELERAQEHISNLTKSLAGILEETSRPSQHTQSI